MFSDIRRAFLVLFKSEKGMSIPEVLAVVVISVISFSLLLSLTLSNRGHKAQINRTSMLKSLLVNNVVEIKVKNIDSLPNVGQCLVRVYDLSQKMLSENKKTLDSQGECTEGDLSSSKIIVVWKIYSSDTINVNFSNSSLKLPKSSSTLKHVKLYVKAKAHGSSNRISKYDISLFKR